MSSTVWLVVFLWVCAGVVHGLLGVFVDFPGVAHALLIDQTLFGLHGSCGSTGYGLHGSCGSTGYGLHGSWNNRVRVTWFLEQQGTSYMVLGTTGYGLHGSWFNMVRVTVMVQQGTSTWSLGVLWLFEVNAKT